MSSPSLPRCLPWHSRARRALGYSLRVRLIGLFLLLALAMGVTFIMGMQYTWEAGWRDAARPLVVDYVDKLSLEIGSPPSIERAQALVQRLPLSVRISGPVVNWRSHPDRPDYGGRDFSAPAKDPSKDPSGMDRDAPRFFERMTADGHRIRFGLNVQALHNRSSLMGWATLLALLALTALAYLRVRRMLRPLDDISAGAKRFGAGDFATPIAVRHAHRPDELGELAATINTMGGDIHQMLEAKRALLLAISHELRSPLTRARLNTELLPETPDVQPNREALLRDLALMRDLVTDLLESERLSNPHAALHPEPVHLGTLVQEVVASLNGTPQVLVDVPAGLPPVQLDPTRVRLLLRNLLDNALRHSAGAAQPPGVQVRLDGHGAVHVTVRDHGPGVPADQLPHLAQPFYRPDAARTREGGGVGLGLYLCKLVALAHGGTFVLRNAQPGLEASVTLLGAH